VGPLVINRLREFQIGQYIREEGPKAHQKKAGTPTMGGLLIAIAIVVPTLLWADLSNRFVWIAVFATCAFAAIGFTGRLHENRTPPEFGTYRAGEVGAAGRDQHCDRIDADRHAGLWNVFDQADCAVPQAVSSRPGGAKPGTISASVAAGVSSFHSFRGIRDRGLEQCGESDGRAGWTGHWLYGDCGGRVDGADLCERACDFCHVLEIPKMPQVGELTIFCGAMVGSSIGFLWYNAHPAEVSWGCGIAGAGRGDWHGRGDHQAGIAVAVYWRSVRDRGGVGDPAGGIVLSCGKSGYSRWRRSIIILS